MPLEIVAAGSGLGHGLSLIIAIGAQNAFVLRQGVRGEHVVPVVAVCAVSDIVLIAGGVAGTGALLDRVPELVDVMRWAGAAFLVGYGALAAGAVWSAVGILVGNGAEEMASIPYLVGGAQAFWLVALPAAAVVLGLEAARCRRRGEG